MAVTQPDVETSTSPAPQVEPATQSGAQADKPSDSLGAKSPAAEAATAPETKPLAAEPSPAFPQAATTPTAGAAPETFPRAEAPPSSTARFAVSAERLRFAEAIATSSADSGSDELPAVETIQEWAAAITSERELDGAIAKLEAAAEKASAAPPHLSFALAALYGRKGLAHKEYAALGDAEKASKARPDVVFALAAVYGRKDTLKSIHKADDLLVGTLAIATEPPGARIFIDGKDSGVSPATIDRLREGKHSIRCSMDGFDDWESTVEIQTGRLSTSKAALGVKPGSIEVRLAPGYLVSLDDGSYEMAPFTFSGVAPGKHLLSFNNPLIDDKFYDTGSDHAVEVSAGKKTVFDKAFPVGRSKVSIRDAPPGSTLELNGKRYDRLDDLEIESGQYDVAVISPIGQRWFERHLARPNENSILKVSNMAAVLPRRTIKMEAKPDSWEGLVPMYESATGSFMGDQAYGIKRFYMCRDDTYLYWRADFQSQNPLVKTPKGVNDRMNATVIVEIGGKHISLDIRFNKQKNAIETDVHLYDDLKHSNTVLFGDGSIAYKIGPNMFVARTKFSNVDKYLKSTYRTRIALARDNWQNESASSPRFIDYAP